MQLLQQLWVDEQGAVVSAEVVTVASVGVMSTVIGLNAMTDAVNGELREFSQSFRSLDQSYHYSGFQGSRAWVAGSSYQQRAVEETLRDMSGPHRPEDWEHRQPADPQRRVDEPKPDAAPPEGEQPRLRQLDNETKALESVETPASEKL